jgi:hypothetical protein
MRMAGIIALCLAAVVVGRGVFILMQERLRLARLVPVTARLTRNQSHMQMVDNQFQQNDAQPAQRMETTHTIEWEYRVNGATHTGTRSGPVPLTAKMPPAEIEVFYDRRDPAVSRLGGETPAGEARPWFIFAGVILAVGLGITVISAGAP